MKRQWQKKEIRDSKDFESRRMPRSGGLWFAPGDNKSKRFLIENKTTKHHSFSVSDKLWEKIEDEALLNKRIPVISLELGNGQELVILDKDDFISLTGER